ncbi:hypothetical protein EDF78_102427 [Rahnella sp. BIGb0236]|jgi:hypothetical protein|nr:hypothetical protein EDF78_102427 [Rahnella sp. BIGb0236]VTQ53978.1 Uncharacterised protein [Campylobacter jejuni]
MFSAPKTSSEFLTVALCLFTVMAFLQAYLS